MTTLLIFALPQLPVAAVAPLRTLQSSDTMTPPLSSHNNIPTLSCTPLTPRQTSNFKSLTLEENAFKGRLHSRAGVYRAPVG